MINKHLAFIILVSIVMYCCTKEIDYEYPPTPDLYVVNALLNPDSAMSVRISKLMPVNELNPIPISGATVQIQDSKERYFTLLHTTDGVYSADFYPEAGEKYTINIEAGENNKMYACTSIPSPNTSITASLGKTWSYFSPPQYIDQIQAYPVFVSIPPQEPGSNLIFRFTVKRFGERNINDSIPDDAPEIPLLTDMIPLFSGDTRFSGAGQDINYVLQTGNLSVEDSTHVLLWVMESIYYSGVVTGGRVTANEFFLDVLTCSPEFYNYFRTYIINVSEKMSPFTEPVEVFSNITNGVGIFAGYSLQRIQLEH